MRGTGAAKVAGGEIYRCEPGCRHKKESDVVHGYKKFIPVYVKYIPVFFVRLGIGREAHATQD